jgi:hypothetical protein
MRIIDGHESLWVGRNYRNQGMVSLPVLTAFASSILPLTMHVMNLLIWSFAVCTCFALVFRKKLILSCTSFLLNVSPSTQAKLHAAIACGIDIQVAPNVMYWAPHVSNFWRSGDFHVLIFISLCPDTFHFSWALRGSRPEAPYHGPIPLVREAFCGTEQLGWPLTTACYGALRLLAASDSAQVSRVNDFGIGSLDHQPLVARDYGSSSLCWAKNRKI